MELMGYGGARKFAFPNIKNHPKRKVDVAHQQISLSEEPRFIERVEVCYATELGVWPAHNTQNNLAPNVLGSLSDFFLSVKIKD